LRFFVIGPLQAAGIVETPLFGIAFALLPLVAIFIVSGSVFAVAAILSCIGLVALATLLRWWQPSSFDIYLIAISWLVSGLTLSVVVARDVFAPGAVTFHRVIGVVLLYLNISLIFVAMFCFVALRAPNAFTGLGPLQNNLAVAGNLIYFSFATLTSTGYGDIVPLHPVARGMTNVEAIIGQLYPATLLARLVTLELQSQQGR
jgi:hypothetical protein